MNKIGFIINPVAGMGGSVALKGTDGAETLSLARSLGAEPHAPGRASVALDEVRSGGDLVTWLVPSGVMGEDCIAGRGWNYRVIHTTRQGDTTAEDTRAAVTAMKEHGAELIVFAGGDGTARDVCAVLEGSGIPVIGIPAGVKIHSAVYGVNPARAGSLLQKAVLGQIRDYTHAEVMDIDEELFRQGRVASRLYGYLTVPLDRSCLQDRKAGAYSGDSYDRGAIASWVADSMKPGRLYLIGSGSTTKAVTDHLGIPGTLLGVDAVKDGKIVAGDLTGDRILALIEPGNTSLVLTIIGGQGHIFGRGNQQLTPEVIRAVGRGNIIVIATPAKLNALFGRPLLVDTGDPALDRELCGYIAVHTGYAVKRMNRVEC